MAVTIDGTTGVSLVQDDTITDAKLALDANASEIKDALNATGSAPIYACRAWVNFNGTGTVAIRGSGNVSSITDNGTADYRVNFTTSMPDTNFCVTSIGSITTDSYNGTTSLYAGSVIGGNPMTTGSVRLRCTGNGGLGNFTDTYYYCVAIFR